MFLLDGIGLNRFYFCFKCLQGNCLFFYWLCLSYRFFWLWSLLLSFLDFAVLFLFYFWFRRWWLGRWGRRRRRWRWRWRWRGWSFSFILIFFSWSFSRNRSLFILFLWWSFPIQPLILSIIFLFWLLWLSSYGLVFINHPCHFLLANFISICNSLSQKLVNCSLYFNRQPR